MDSRVVGAFAAHDGLLSRAQLLDLGLPPADIRWLVRAQRLVRVRRGIFTTAEVWNSLDPYVGRPLLTARAAIRQMRRGWVLSHDSAAHALGMPILTPNDPLVHVTRPGFTNAWTENGVSHHLARFLPQQVVDAHGLPALDAARTAVDIARDRGFTDGLVACDSALRLGASRSALHAAYEPMTNWPGVRAARACVEHADRGAANPNETLGRELVLEAGIGGPETQFPVRTSQGVRWCDMRVGNHVIETDGRVKYRSVEEGGVATRPADEVAWEERKRERMVRDRSLVVTRLYWEDYWGKRRSAAIERVRADHADSVERFGADLAPHLAAEAAEIREDERRRPPA